MSEVLNLADDSECLDNLGPWTVDYDREEGGFKVQIQP